MSWPFISDDNNNSKKLLTNYSINIKIKLLFCIKGRLEILFLIPSSALWCCLCCTHVILLCVEPRLKGGTLCKSKKISKFSLLFVSKKFYIWHILSMKVWKTKMFWVQKYFFYIFQKQYDGDINVIVKCVEAEMLNFWAIERPCNVSWNIQDKITCY